MPVLGKGDVTTIDEYKPFGRGNGINPTIYIKENKSLGEDEFS